MQVTEHLRISIFAYKYFTILIQTTLPHFYILNKSQDKESINLRRIEKVKKKHNAIGDEYNQSSGILEVLRHLYDVIEQNTICPTHLCCVIIL
jgi:5-bromo-4-chloroindolyl phosphate hydrolysis protein